MFITHIIYIYKQFQKKGTTNAVANIVLLHIIKLYVLKHIGQIYKLLLFLKLSGRIGIEPTTPRL